MRFKYPKTYGMPDNETREKAIAKGIDQNTIEARMTIKALCKKIQHEATVLWKHHRRHYSTFLAYVANAGWSWHSTHSSQTGYTIHIIQPAESTWSMGYRVMTAPAQEMQTIPLNQWWYVQLGIPYLGTQPAKED